MTGTLGPNCMQVPGGTHCIFVSLRVSGHGVVRRSGRGEKIQWYAPCACSASVRAADLDSVHICVGTFLALRAVQLGMAPFSSSPAECLGGLFEVQPSSIFPVIMPSHFRASLLSQPQRRHAVDAGHLCVISDIARSLQVESVLQPALGGWLLGHPLAKPKQDIPLGLSQISFGVYSVTVGSEGPVAYEAPHNVQDRCHESLLALLAYLQHQLLVFIRSFLLFFLVSTVHLCAWTCPVKKGQGRRNGTSLRVRSCLRGAPILWALFIVAHCLPLCCAGGSPRGTQPEVPQRAEGGRDTTQVGGDVGFSSSLPEQRASPASDTAGPPPEYPARAAVALPSLPPDVKFLVCLYEFQRPVSFACVWGSDAQVVDDLIGYLLAEQVGGAGTKTVIPVVPQPRANGVAVIVADVWNLALLQCPVLIQVFGGPYKTFVEYFTGRVTSQDVRRSVGALWRPGAQIYVGEDKVPLPEDEFFSPVPGLLARVSPPSLIPGPAVDLQTCLSSPAEWLHDVEKWGFPSEDTGAGKICVLGVWADQQVCHVNRSTTSAGLREQVLEHCGFSHRSVTFCTPRRHVADFATRSITVRSVIGIVPQALESCIGVFVDARCLACKLQFVLLPPVRTTLNSLLQLIGAIRPVGWKLVVHGSSTFDPSCEAFLPEHASLLVLEVRSEVDSQSAVPVTGHALNDVGSRFAAPVPEASGDALVVPSISQSTGAFSCGPSTDIHGSQTEILCDPSRNSGPLSNSTGNSMHGQVILPFQWRSEGQSLLLQAPEVPDPRQFVLGDPEAEDADEANEELLEGPTSAEETSSTVPELKRVLCCILGFQARPQFRTQWTTDREDLQSFLDRIGIILNPDAEQFALVCIEPQPVDSMLSLLLVPSWWATANVRAFTVSSSFEDIPFFMQTAREDQGLEELLPCSVFRMHPSVDAYTCRQADVARVEAEYFPPHGSLLYLQVKGDPPPVLSSPQQVLDGLPHLPPDSRVPEASGPVPEQVLVLGVYFDQTLTELPLGATDAAVAAAVHLEEVAFHVHWLAEPFRRVSCEGVPVDRFVACRPSCFRCRLPDACGLFFDCRRLGRPVCYRSSHSSRLAVDEVLRLVDVALPEGMCLCLTGGVFDLHTQMFSFADGAKVVMWAEAMEDPDARTEVASTVSGGEEVSSNPSAVVPSPDGEVGRRSGGRSRSPRRPSGNLEGQATEVICGPVSHKVDCDIVAHDGSLWIERFCQPACGPCHACDTSESLWVPLPCERSGCTSSTVTEEDCSIADLDACHGGTVLSSSDKSQRLHFLAAIGSLFEQSYHKASSATVTSAEGCTRSVLCIAQHVDPPVFDLSKQQFPVGRCIEEVFRLVHAKPFALNSTLPDGLCLHPAAQEVLAGVVPIGSCAGLADRVDVFTDGSFQQGSSAWAAVFLESVGETVCPGAGLVMWYVLIDAAQNGLEPLIMEFRLPKCPPLPWFFGGLSPRGFLLLFIFTLTPSAR